MRRRRSQRNTLGSSLRICPLHGQVPLQKGRWCTSEVSFEHALATSTKDDKESVKSAARDFYIPRERAPEAQA
jgi:hypothetical protein